MKIFLLLLTLGLTSCSSFKAGYDIGYQDGFLRGVHDAVNLTEK
jgi:hypothetical protein